MHRPVLRLQVKTGTLERHKKNGNGLHLISKEKLQTLARESGMYGKDPPPPTHTHTQTHTHTHTQYKTYQLTVYSSPTTHTHTHTTTKRISLSHANIHTTISSDNLFPANRQSPPPLPRSRTPSGYRQSTASRDSMVIVQFVDDGPVNLGDGGRHDNGYDRLLPRGEFDHLCVCKYGRVNSDVITRQDDDSEERLPTISL